MLRAYHRRPLFLALLICGCGADEGPASSRTADPEGACTALAEVAKRARDCDPALASLSEAMLRDPDEQTCRQEVRRILSAVPSDSNIHSVHEGAVAGEQPPLSTEERDRLAALPLPGILTIVPDLPRQPGLPTTSASLDDRQLDVRADGSFFVHVAPGEHTLVIRHAGGQSDACIRIEACERIALTAHGSHLARHERVSPGACGTPGLEAATGDD